MNPDEIAVNAQRKRWMSVLAQADTDTLEVVCRPLHELTLAQWQWLRPPETGLVMVRGRAGGTGTQFNLGEVTVTRCALRLQPDGHRNAASGKVGVAYVQGRRARHAELAARLDALLQEPASCDRIRAHVIEPLAAAQAARRDQIARKAAATKVEFYTLAREAQTPRPSTGEA